MIQNAKKPRKPQLRVRYAEANRVRSLLLSEDVQMLSKRDVQTLLKILDDVYPIRRRSSQLSVWQPLLIGIGIGLLLMLGIALVI
jgi:hypothetical protein